MPGARHFEATGVELGGHGGFHQSFGSCCFGPRCRRAGGTRGSWRGRCPVRWFGVGQTGCPSVGSFRIPERSAGFFPGFRPDEGVVPGGREDDAGAEHAVGREGTELVEFVVEFRVGFFHLGRCLEWFRLGSR